MVLGSTACNQELWLKDLSVESRATKVLRSMVNCQAEGLGTFWVLKHLKGGNLARLLVSRELIFGPRRILAEDFNQEPSERPQ